VLVLGSYRGYREVEECPLWQQ